LYIFSPQEYPIKLEQCPGPGLLCDWKDFVDIYKDKLECKFDEICSEDDIKTSSASDFKEEEEISNSSSRFSNSTINNLLIFMLLAFRYSIQCNSKWSVFISLFQWFSRWFSTMALRHIFHKTTPVDYFAEPKHWS